MPPRTAAATEERELKQRPHRLQIGISFREFAKGRIHSETGVKIFAGFAHVAEQRVVAAHVVVIDRLFQEGERAAHENFFGLRRFSELVQTKSGVKKSSAAIRGDAAKFSADGKRAQPAFAAHEMMQAQLQNLRAILKSALDRVQFGDGFAAHAELGIATRCTEAPIVTHALFLSRPLAKNRNAIVDLAL